MPDTAPPATEATRLDKWLWCVRAYKTRALAAEACRHERVTVDGQVARASRAVRAGQVVAINLGGWTRSLRVLQPLEKRVGAAAVPGFAADVTSAEEIERSRQLRVQNLLARPHGEGRPTKRERRALDRAFQIPFE